MKKYCITFAVLALCNILNLHGIGTARNIGMKQQVAYNNPQTTECPFCKIVSGESTESYMTVFQNDHIQVIEKTDQDTKSKQRMWYIFPKKHISSLQSLNSYDTNLIGELFLLPVLFAKEQGHENYAIGTQGYKRALHTNQHLVVLFTFL